MSSDGEVTCEDCLKRIRMDLNMMRVKRRMSIFRSRIEDKKKSIELKQEEVAKLNIINEKDEEHSPSHNQ